MIINRTDNAGVLTVLRSGCLICNLHQEKRKEILCIKEEELLKRCTEILSKELPVLRKINNLTQKDLGDIIGVSRQTVTNIESGKSEMKWTTFLAIMFVFSLDHGSVEYLRRIRYSLCGNKAMAGWKEGRKIVYGLFDCRSNMDRSKLVDALLESLYEERKNYDLGETESTHSRQQ